MGIADLLSRLDRVQQTGQGNWRAVCPAHVSKNRSQTLQVSERHDGSIGLHCFANCETGAVLAAIGLRMTDLFAEPLTKERLKPGRMFSPAAMLETLAGEGKVVLMAGAMMIENQKLSETDWQQLVAAMGKINAAWELHLGR